MTPEASAAAARCRRAPPRWRGRGARAGARSRAPATRKPPSCTRSTFQPRSAAGRKVRCSASSAISGASGGGASAGVRRKISRDELVEARVGRRGRDEHRHGVGFLLPRSSSAATGWSRSRHSARPAPPPPATRGRPSTARAIRGRRREPRVVRASSARPSRSSPPGPSRRAARGRARARAAACARRGRGSRARGPRRRSRPRSGRGCRRARAGGRRRSIVPSTGSSVVNG